MEIQYLVVDKMFEMQYNYVVNTVQNGGDNMDHIGDKIRRIRQESNLTQEQLSKKSGISRTHIVEIEAGKYSPTFKTLTAIAIACGKSVKDLI